MYKEIVSQLSLSPAAASQLALYSRKLKREHTCRLLSVVGVALVISLQFAIIVAPPSASNSTSPNDIVPGGFISKEDLINKYDSSAELRQVYSYIGITRNDIVTATVKTVNSHTPGLSSVSRLRFDAKDSGISINGRKYWSRPLDHTDSPVNAILGSNYRVLEGRHETGEYFAIVLSSGNAIVGTGSLNRSIAGNKPSVLADTSNVAPASSPVSSSADPCANPIYKTISAFNISQDADAITLAAAAGDVIRFTLNTKNLCSKSLNYQVSDSIQDILEYSDIIDSGGATMATDTLTWPTDSIRPAETLIKTFLIKVKNPIPTTPVGTTDPLSYDLRMDNHFGNDIRINISAPLVKSVEATANLLPISGPGPTTLIVLLVAGFILFFYFRNRQIILEIKHLRNDYDGGVK